MSIGIGDAAAMFLLAAFGVLAWLRKKAGGKTWAFRIIPFGIMLMALAVFAIVQIIQDTFLTPKIMGHVTGLNSAIILLSLSIWGSLLGILGMIIALPMTTLLINYYQKYVIKKE